MLRRAQLSPVRWFGLLIRILGLQLTNHSNQAEVKVKAEAEVKAKAKAKVEKEKIQILIHDNDLSLQDFNDKKQKMSEVLFLVKEADEGRYSASALGYSIFTEAASWDELRNQVKDAVLCHFDDDVTRIVRYL
ncbi:MAG: hypothetical protein ABJB16_05015 [Saprospiraceae bacterium]